MEKRKLATCVIFLCVFFLLGSDAAGEVQWENDGVAIGVGPGDQTSPCLVPDGFGGTIIAWSDGDIHAQRIDGSGMIQWPAGGIAVCSASGEQEDPRIASDGSGGAFILWSDSRGNTTVPYIQRINANGGALWVPNGKLLCAADSSQLSADLIADGVGGAIVVWQDRRFDDFFDIYAQKVDAEGNTLWGENGLAICAAPGYQSSPQITSDGSGGAIIVWRDSGDLFAQRVVSGGTVTWATNGIAVCDAEGGQSKPCLASDGSGGVIITWADYRGGYVPDVYAQRLDETGLAKWAANGLEVGTAANDMGLSSLRITPDGSNGANIAWGDFSATAYVQRLDAEGNALWNAGGLSLRDTVTHRSQWEPSIISDGVGGVIATYWLYIGGDNHDIYAQKVDGDGNILWTMGGTGLCTLTSNQQSPQLASDGAGGAIVAWEDWRNGDTDVYAQRISTAGQVSTLLQSYNAAVSGSDITITWTVSEMSGDCRFNILRTIPGTDIFEQLRDPRIEDNGLSFEFRDESCEPGETYRYRVEVLEEGTRHVLFETEEVALPSPSLVLYQNHPNPFRWSTNIPFVLHERTEASLSVYDIKGRLVTVLFDNILGEGPKEIRWDGRDASGNPVASGIYLYRLEAGNRILTRKALLLR